MSSEVGSDTAKFNLEAGENVRVDVNSTATTAFQVYDGNTGTIRFAVDVNGGGVTINDSFTFPNGDGNNGQVLQTDGVGNVTWEDVSGGTGSTSPAGSDTQIQFNDSGSFGANTGFTFSPLSGNVLSVQSGYGTSGSTTKMSRQFVGIDSLSSIEGAGTLYTNSDAPNYATINAIGNLNTLGLSDNGVVVGNFNFGGGRVGLFAETGATQMALVDNNANYNSNVLVDYIGIGLNYVSGNTESSLQVGNGGVQAHLNPVSGDTKQFAVTNGSGVNYFSVDYSPQYGYSGITFFEAYTFPTTDGSANQVLETNGVGELSWVSVSGGGSSIMVVGGGSNSTVRDGVGNQATSDRSAALGGGGNTASGYYSTIAGGSTNEAGGNCSFVGGGQSNSGTTEYSTIGGGCGNTASGTYATIAGGGGMMGGNCATGCASFIGGGGANTASGYYSVVAGGGGMGGSNSASGNYSAVLGGYGNTAIAHGSTVGGGYNNTASGYYSVVAGGNGNTASGFCSTIVGGQDNTAGGAKAAIVGGLNNTASGDYSFVGNGNNNTDSGCSCAMIVGSNITADRACTTFMNNLSVKNIPTSAAGLPSGSVWSSGGTLMIV